MSLQERITHPKAHLHTGTSLALTGQRPGASEDEDEDEGEETERAATRAVTLPAMMTEEQQLEAAVQASMSR